MRILLSTLLVFGIVAGVGAAFRGPHWYGPRYGYAYGPCAPGWYGNPGWTGPWGSGGPTSTPPAPPAGTPPAPAGPTQ